MKILKGLMLSVVILLSLCHTACESGKYSDVQEVLNGQANACRNYIGAMEKAENPQDVAAAINSFTSDTKELMPKIKKIRAKCPWFRDKQQPCPMELKALTDELKELGNKMVNAGMKNRQYEQDPVVLKAFKDQLKVWAMFKD